MLPLLTGCIAETGPVAIENSHPFPGLANLLEKVPTGGSLNIFVTHGMSTKADESEADLRESIAQNLHLNPDGTQVQVSLLADPLRDPPDIGIDGASIWPANYNYDDWACTNHPNHLDRCDGPYLDINNYKTADGKEVVFYSLNYWGVLVWLKCSQLDSADTRLIGDLTVLEGNAAYCNSRFAGRPGFPIPTGAVSSEALIIDHVIKNQIMDWGFGDAVIAISRYRAVLHQAVYAGLAKETNDVIKRYIGKHQRVMLQPEPTLLGDRNLRLTQQYAIITESLGSYVLLDALGAATDRNKGLAGLKIACRASQIHMLANQVALLRLSRTRVKAEQGSALAQDEALLGRVDVKPMRCGDDGQQRPYVVGYHDPSDLLTFYLYHPAEGATYSFESQLDTRMINVVAPFAQEWVPFALADPDQAHVAGQQQDPRIQDMVSFGSNGFGPNTGLAPDPGPPPLPGNP
jgi:hypothetical protein